MKDENKHNTMIDTTDDKFRNSNRDSKIEKNLFSKTFFAI